MTRIVDISVQMDDDLLIWPGNPPLTVTPWTRLARGDGSNVSDVRLGTHTGTHVDPPFHHIDDGVTVERLPLQVMVGEAVIGDLTESPGPIGAAELDRLALAEGTSRLLLKTRNSRLWASRQRHFPDQYVALAVDGAAWLVDHGIRLLGFDFLSVEARGALGRPVHRTLLDNGVVIVEGLDLSQVNGGKCFFVFLPLKLAGADGAPGRAVLLETTPMATDEP